MRSTSRSLVSCFRTPTYLYPKSQPPSIFPNRPPSRGLFSAGLVERRACGGSTRTWQAVDLLVEFWISRYQVTHEIIVRREVPAFDAPKITQPFWSSVKNSKAPDRL